MDPRIAGNRSPLGGLRRCLTTALLGLSVGVHGLALDPARPLQAHAQHTWRSEDGLLQDTVTALVESRDGFLWVGTEAGLVRFDGATFDRYSRVTVPGFAHNEIQCLAEGDGGALWVGTSEPGLYLLRRGAVRAFGAREGLPDRPIRRLLRDRRGTLWAAPTEGPLLRFDGARFQAVPTDSPQLRIRALTEAPDGALWVGTAGSGLWRLDQGRLVLAALAASDITALEAAPDGAVWVGTRTQGLQLYQEGRLEAPAWARALPRRAVTVLLQDREGSLWVGLEQGGLLRRTQGGLLEAAPSAGARWTPLALLEDSSGALWSGSEDRGLRVLYPVPFQAIPSVGGDPEEPAGMVCQDAQGTVWCLTADASLGILHQGRLERSPQGGPLRGALTALWPRAAGGLWLGTRNGELFRFDQGRLQRVASAPGGPADPIQALYEDPRQTLWVAHARQGLQRLAPGGERLHYPTLQGVQGMAGGGDGPLYLASRTQGLGVLEGGETRWLGRSEGLGSNRVQALYLDAEGYLWIGTTDGLRRFRDGTFQTFEAHGGPLVLAIHAILEDARHQMWFGTGQGVLRFPRTALMGEPDQVPGSAVVTFNHHDGLPSRETYVGPQPAAWRTREGDLFFPTSRGLARLAQGAQPPVGPPIRIHILKAESDETVLPETRPILVPPGTHRFEIYYTATSLTRADKLQFRYRLEGWEHQWNEVGDRRFAPYSNLPPGTYRFVLQASRLGEEGPPLEQALDVRVQPFLFERPVFWLVCAVAVFAFVWWLLRLRLQQVEARSAVLAERNRMAREIHDHLAQGFTGVLLQLEAAEAKLAHLPGDSAPILTRLNHARDLAVASLQEARRSVMTLSPRKMEGANLLEALRILADRLLAGTNIQVELAQTGEARPLRRHLEEELLRMAQELLTNALRHGKARWVRVTLQFSERRVLLNVEDDGLGFDPAVASAGYGMRSIRESLRQLGGHLDIDSIPGFGARITLSLPLRRWRP